MYIYIYNVCVCVCVCVYVYIIYIYYIMYKHIRSRRHRVTWACWSIALSHTNIWSIRLSHTNKPSFPRAWRFQPSLLSHWDCFATFQHAEITLCMHSRRFKDACSSRVPLARQVQIGGGEYLIDTILCIFGGGQAWQEQEAGNTWPMFWIWSWGRRRKRQRLVAHMSLSS